MLALRRPPLPAPAVPTLGRWASLRFATDVERFLAEGRACGALEPPGPDFGPRPGPWAFHLDGARVLVVDTRDAAEAVLRGSTRFYRGEVLAPLLGRTSPLLDLVPSREADPAPSGCPYRRDDAPAAGLRVGEWLAPDIFIRSEIYMRGISDIDGPPVWPRFDAYAALRRAAVRWVVAALMPGAAPQGPAVAAAEALLDAADTPAIAVPWLRRWSPRWRRLPAAREAFLHAVGLETLVREVDGLFLLVRGVAAAERERAQDLAVTALVGAADAPVLLALEALSCPPPPIKRSALDAAEEAEGPAGRRNLIARAAVSAALERRPPIPLALREVVRAVEVPGLGVLGPGQAVAVDLGAAGWPFGKWAHACPGAGDGRAFAEAAVRVCSELGLRAAPQRLRRRRVRLAWGLERLLVEARAVARGGA